MNTVLICLAVMAAVSITMYAINEWYLSLGIEERHAALLKEHAPQIIANRKSRFVIQKLIRCEVKKSDEWNEFLNAKKTGTPISNHLRESIHMEMISTTYKVERELVLINTFQQIIDSEEIELEEPLYI